MRPQPIAAALVALAACSPSAAPPAAHAAPPAQVGVITLHRKDLPLFIDAVATLDGYVNADIRARVRGFLRSQNYKDGAMVKAGQTLFTIDPSEYTVAAASAKATLARAKVAQSRAQIELDRDVGLFKTGNLSQQDFDNAKAALADADGQVQAAQAAVDQANLNLSYTNIKSPIPGIAGLAQVRVGNLVGQDQPTLLAVVSQTDPLRVTFPLSELDYVKSPGRFRNMDQRDLAWARAQFAQFDQDPRNPDAVELILADGSSYAHRGVVVSVNRNIDSSTGTIQLQALVANPDAALRPGQYARVRLRRAAEGHQVLAVPEKALVAVQGTYFLAVVDATNKVSLKRVDLGPSANGMRVVLGGVNEGDRVIVEGTQSATDGATVDPHPAAEAAPGAAERN